MSYSMVLLSAGKGLRFGNATPKQYLLLAGKPIIVHILENAEKVKDIDEIIIVCSPEYNDVINTYVKKYNITKNISFVKGGATRQESVYNGINAAKNQRIILHEAARPFVSVEDFNNLINCPHDNVSYTYSIPYTVLKQNSDGYISDILNRDELVNIQLPQKFVKDTLMECHKKAINDNKLFTEDAGMLREYSSEQVYCLKGKPYNIKITEYLDLLFGEILYKEVFLEEK